MTEGVLPSFFLTFCADFSNFSCIIQDFYVPLPSQSNKENEKKSMTFKLNEAIAYAKEKGLVGKKELTSLAEVLWPESNKHSAYMNFLNLKTGRSKKVDIENVPTICRILGVSADFLFGLTDVPNITPKKDEIADKAREIVSIVSNL